MDELEEIMEEAVQRFRSWLRQGVRGQTVMPQDGLEYWVWLITKERYANG